MKYLFIAVLAIAPACALSQVSGSGTAGQVAKWTGTTAIGNSLIFDNGSGIGIGGNALNFGLQQQLSIINNTGTSGGYALIGLQNTDSTGGMELEFWNVNTGTAHSAAGLSGSGLMYLNNGASNASDVWFGTLGGDYTFWKDGNLGTARDLTIFGSGGLNVAVTSALGSSSSNFGNLWFDSGNLTLQANNSSGTLSTMVFPNACAGQVVGSINSDGTVTCVSGGLSNFLSAAVASTMVNINSNCSILTPCNVNIGGNNWVQVSASSSLTAVPAGYGTAYIYEDDTPACYVAAITSISTSNCTYFNANAFPNGVTPIAQIGWAGGAWSNLKLAQPASTRVENFISSTGITCSDDGQNKTCGVDTSVVPTGNGTQNYVPHWDSTGYNLVNGLLEDDGSNGVGIGGSAQNISGQESLSVIHNTTGGGAVRVGIHNSDTSGYTVLSLFPGTTSTSFDIGATGGGDAYMYNGFSNAAAFDFGVASSAILYRFWKAGSFFSNVSFSIDAVNAGFHISSQTLSSYGTCSGANLGQYGEISDGQSGISLGSPAAAGGSTDYGIHCGSSGWMVFSN